VAEYAGNIGQSDYLRKKVKQDKEHITVVSVNAHSCLSVTNRFLQTCFQLKVEVSTTEIEASKILNEENISFPGS